MAFVNVGELCSSHVAVNKGFSSFRCLRNPRGRVAQDRKWMVAVVGELEVGVDEEAVEVLVPGEVMIVRVTGPSADGILSMAVERVEQRLGEEVQKYTLETDEGPDHARMTVRMWVRPDQVDATKEELQKAFLEASPMKLEALSDSTPPEMRNLAEMDVNAAFADYETGEFVRVDNGALQYQTSITIHCLDRPGLNLRILKELERFDLKMRFAVSARNDFGDRTRIDVFHVTTQRGSKVDNANEYTIARSLYELIRASD
uniref:ACT domain-containing protein n=1 Tax=Compsopogon caeruleus TaxID=31354 RepID=A0A7S1TH01_9RHOD